MTSSKKSRLAAMILAAGKGTRMKSDVPKVLHQVCGWPLVAYPIKVCQDLKVASTVLVVSKGSNDWELMAKEYGFKNVVTALQDPPLGTGHAVMMGLKKLASFEGDVLIMYGDVPLLHKETVQSLWRQHQKQKADLTLAVAHLENAGQYGRVVRNAQGGITSLVEARDATSEQKKIHEINVGLYVVRSDFLKKALKGLSNHNAQKEYYLTDLVALAFKQGKTVASMKINDAWEWQGVNNQYELTFVEKELTQRKIKQLAFEGVRFMNPESIVMDSQVSVGAGSLVCGPVYLWGQTQIGRNCVLEPGCVVKDSRVAQGSVLKASSYIDTSVIGASAQIGPFAHLRPQSRVGAEAKVGNFVELKKTTLGPKAKANHLSYLGDAQIGAHVNIGAGTITCNYDGVHKYQTVLEEGVFVGSDTQFVAPVRVGKGAYIGAGSTITKDVSSGSLALSRAPQKEIPHWASKKKKPHHS